MVWRDYGVRFQIIAPCSAYHLQSAGQFQHLTCLIQEEIRWFPENSHVIDSQTVRSDSPVNADPSETCDFCLSRARIPFPPLFPLFLQIHVLPTLPPSPVRTARFRLHQQAARLQSYLVRVPAPPR